MSRRTSPGLMDRRQFLGLAAVGAGAVALATLPGCSLFGSRDAISTVGEVDFRNPLAIPPLAEATRDGTETVFRLVTQVGESRIVPSGPAETWGVNGPILGPTLRANRGEQVRVEMRNDLPETTTIHWHGMRLPAAADGGPHQPVEPGGIWSPSWTIDQPAATLWYHPHPHGDTEGQVYRGIGGLFIVDDPVEAALDLPREYGVDDIPVIVQDKTFDESGRLVRTSQRVNGMLGDTILVNGTAGPVLNVEAELTRLRLLNASTARSYAFGLSDGGEMTMIASDGGLLAEPVELTRVRLTPGERAEVLVRMRPGDTKTLRSYPQDLGLSGNRSRDTGAADTLDILRLDAGDTLRASSPPPSRLDDIERLDQGSVTENRNFELQNNRINGERMDMERIDTVVTAGSTEIWEVSNGHSQPHNFHVHDLQFQVLEIDGSAPPPEQAGWKDTIYLPPDQPVKLIMRFSESTDPDLPYMYHCHLLWHEDEGMMGQFTVVDPIAAEQSPAIGYTSGRPAGNGICLLEPSDEVSA